MEIRKIVVHVCYIRANCHFRSNSFGRPFPIFFGGKILKFYTNTIEYCEV